MFVVRSNCCPTCLVGVKEAFSSCKYNSCAVIIERDRTETSIILLVIRGVQYLYKQTYQQIFNVN